MQRRIPFSVPPCYTSDYFKSDIELLLEKVRPAIKGAILELRAIDYSEVIEKDGRKFNAHIFGILGEVCIRIEKVSE